MDITDSQFEEQVLKSDKPVLVDFWAPWCIDPNTLVLTESGYGKASQIQIGTKLFTFDPKTKKESVKTVKKIRIFKNVAARKMVLETQRTLIGDENHLVFTQEGFKSLQKLKKGDMVLVNPLHEGLEFHPSLNSTIFNTTGNIFADKILSSQGLLPLTSSNPNLSILARLLGYVMTDGYLYEDKKHNIYETHFFVGTKQDAEMIQRDLKEIGFEKLEIKFQEKERIIDKRAFTMRIIRCRNFNRALFYLLKSLGAPVGRKKNQAYFVPEWILWAEAAIKKEFLSGWLGGDGCKISYFKRYEGKSSHFAGFKVNPIEFHKEKELEKEGILYAKQLGLLFEELGIRISNIESCDDSDGVIISLRIATDYESLFNLASIGYSYASTKNSQVPHIQEFLSYRLFERKRYENKKQVVLQKLALGIDTKRIGEELDIPIRTVVTWKYNTKALVVHPSLAGEALFDKWIENRQEEKLLWEKIDSIEDVDKRDVIGITVDAPHTLVTNGIISHNCGPCKMVSPIVEELGEEYKDKVKVVKVNVDDNPKYSGQYGVMSIPSIFIFKKGQPVKTMVGAQSKDNFKRAIDEALAS